MKKYLTGESNYDKYPTTTVKGCDGAAFAGYDAICAELLKRKKAHTGSRFVVTVDCNTAVDIQALKKVLVNGLKPDKVFGSAAIFQDNDTIQKSLALHVTEDRVFGKAYYGTWDDFVDGEKLEQMKNDAAQADGFILIIGVAAGYVTDADVLVFADMTIWESQMRYRKEKMCNFAVHNPDEDYIRKFKRGYFIDWRLNNRHKPFLFNKFDYYLDTVVKDSPAMITRQAFDKGLLQMLNQPFRTIPFFDEGLWGGQWLREVCDIQDDSKPNFAWSYNLLFPENEVNLTFGNVKINVPGYTVCQKYPKQLIGQKGYARFGAEYPIRYDFLDTMDGGNLSLQVHPTTQYIQERFAMPVTQDESYYYLDCTDDCHVYLGLKTDADKDAMAKDLYEASKGGKPFDAEKYVNKIPVKKHEHYHIPAGTVHASGTNGMVLEISAHPCIFTFKLWDWGRVGLDGIPRPIHLEHGLANIQFDRQTDWIMETCAFAPIPLRSGTGFREEKIGLHEYEYIQTNRIWATEKYSETTMGETHALNLVEGAEALIESPTGQFAPFVIHYAESVCIPALVNEYTVRPYGRSEGKEIGIVKSFVKF
jgi:mannose-6-phosphate isomerase class I